MKRNLLAVIFAFAVMVFSSNSMAENDVQLSDDLKDLKGLIGKTIVFKGGFSRGNTFICSITGVSEYVVTMGRTVLLSVSGVDYEGQEVKQLVYEFAYPANNNGWTVEYAGKKVKINVTEIE